MDWSRVKHFSREEFGTGETGVEPDPCLVEMLDKARDLAGIPFAINSGLRTEERNAQVGGVPGSAHTKGMAVDISAKDSRSRFLIVDALLAVGACRIGISGKGNFVHVDVDLSKPQDVMWLYR